MREFELLPDWYPKLRRQRLIFRAQLVLLVSLTVAGLFWYAATTVSAAQKRRALSDVDTQLEQVLREQQQLGVLLNNRDRMREQKRVISRLGYPIEVSQLFATLGTAMPPEMSLVSVDITTNERKVGGLALKGGLPGATGASRYERDLRVRLTGVTPTDVDVARLMDALTDEPFIPHVHLNHLRERAESGHIMREFDLWFLIDLDAPVEEAEQP